MTKRFNKIYEDYTEQFGFSNVLDRISPPTNKEDTKDTYDLIKINDFVHVELFNSKDSQKGGKSSNVYDTKVVKKTDRELELQIFVEKYCDSNTVSTSNRVEDIKNPYYNKDMDKELSKIQKINIDADNRGFEEQFNFIKVKKDDIKSIAPIDDVGKWFILVREKDGEDLHKEPLENGKINQFKLTDPEKKVKDDEMVRTTSPGFEKTTKDFTKNNVSDVKAKDVKDADTGKINSKKVENKSKGLEKNKNKKNRITVKDLLTKIKGVKR